MAIAGCTASDDSSAPENKDQTTEQASKEKDTSDKEVKEEETSIESDSSKETESKKDEGSNTEQSNDQTSASSTDNKEGPFLLLNQIRKKHLIQTKLLQLLQR